MVVNGPATLDGALQVSFTNDFVAANGDAFSVLGYTSRSGGFASSSAGALDLTEFYTQTNLVLISGSNAFPSLTFTVASGNTQTVCVPFQLFATATDVDGAVTNVSLFMSGSPLAGANGTVVETTAEIDFAGQYSFTASAADDRGGLSWATQEVTVVTQPLHVLTAGGFRTNGSFKLCLSGEPGRSYQLQASTDLNSTNWVVVGVMNSTNGTWRFLDAEATNNTARFYRVEQLP